MTIATASASTSSGGDFDEAALRRRLSALEEDAAREDSRHDFGMNIIPRLIQSAKVYSSRFHDENKQTSTYWRDIGTLDSYYEASMDLVKRHALHGVEMRGSGNLFNQLTILLDQIVIASFQETNAEGVRCSINLNVESVFTRGFEAFIDRISSR